MTIDLISVESTRTRISLGAFKNARIPLPPIDEQKLIAHYLDVEISKLQSLIAKAQQAIALMREHRTSLIAAAVTGKIDVRGEGVGAGAGSGAETEARRLAGVAR